MDNQFKFQTGKELLEKSIEQWTQEGFFNYDDNGTSFSNKKFDNSEEEAFIQNMENDPVVNLFMTALAHQTNLLKEQILSIQSSLLSEFVKLTSPYHLTRAIPAMSVMQICPSGGFDSSWADDSTVILLEKKSKTKMRFKELEKFSFLPLLKTKILNAKLKSVRKTAKNIFELEIAGESAIGNLSGMSLFLPRIQATNMQILVNDRPLPVISMNDFEKGKTGQCSRNTRMECQSQFLTNRLSFSRTAVAHVERGAANAVLSYDALLGQFLQAGQNSGTSGGRACLDDIGAAKTPDLGLNIRADNIVCGAFRPSD